tara:strand:+ start:121 stop:918 length:798 start_codon:yes stop_codon:yes gene_type:complete
MKLEDIASSLRLDIIKMSNRAKAPHLASSLSCIDIVITLYEKVLNIFPKQPKKLSRDKFILSKGHAATALYVTLAYKGFFPKKKLLDYTKKNSLLEEHPNPSIKGVEMATGSLGHGLPVGCGLALSGKIKKLKYKTVVLLGDGECNEGTIWESAMFASSKKLEHLYIIVDQNGWQGIGKTKDILNVKTLKKRWASFGWNSFEIDGHNFKQIEKIFKLKNNGKPTAIIAKTTKGKGISFMENDNNWHYRIPTSEEVILAKRELKIK